MKELLIKEHYCYKIQTLLMESSAYSRPSVDKPPIWTTPPPPPFSQKSFEALPSMIFKNLNPPPPRINKGVFTLC